MSRYIRPDLYLKFNPEAYLKKAKDTAELNITNIQPLKFNCTINVSKKMLPVDMTRLNSSNVVD